MEGGTLSRMALVEIPASGIVDWESFHDTLAEALRFPDYYGRNGNAFLDCLRDILDGRDVPRTLGPGESLTIDLGELGDLRARCPEQLAALVDWTSWANGEQIDLGNEGRVVLAFRG